MTGLALTYYIYSLIVSDYVFRKVYHYITNPMFKQLKTNLTIFKSI